MSRVRSLLSMHSKLFGNSLKPKPNGCALVTAGLGMTITLSINRCSHFEREKDLLVQTSRLWQPRRFDVIQAEPERQKEALPAAGCPVFCVTQIVAQVLV